MRRKLTMAVYRLVRPVAVRIRTLRASPLERVLDEVYQWQSETFPDRTAASVAAHLLEEAGELDERPHSAEEMADVAMLLHSLARMTDTDLVAAIEAKLRKNRTRDFSGPPNGSGYVKAR